MNVVRGAYAKLKSLAKAGNAGDIEERSTATDYSQIGPNALQRNKCAVHNTIGYTIVWHYLDDISPQSVEAEEFEETTGRGRNTLDGHVVRELEVGDSVSVWARARFAGWVNHVERASVRVFWAI